MKTVLVTGSNGLLGQKLIAELLVRPGLRVVATSKSSDRINYLTGYEFDLLDITNKTELHYILSKWQPHVIINTAALTQPDYCHDHADECWDVNAKAVGLLAETAESLNAHLIHLSTDFVFDGLNGPYTEQALPNPLSIYGRSKLEGELQLQKFTCSNAVVRTILVYGVLPSLSRSNIILWVKNSLEAGMPIRVINDQYRMPTLVEDLAWACAEIALGNKTGTWHISGDEMYSILDIAMATAAFFKLDQSLITPVSTFDLKEKVKRPAATGFNLYKAKTELQYQPRTLLQGLELMRQQLL